MMHSLPSSKATLANLPTELLDQIFVSLAHHRGRQNVFRRTALICRALLPYSRAHLYRHVALTCRSGDMSCVLQFSRAISSNHSLGPLVFTLEVDRFTPPIQHAGYPNAESCPSHPFIPFAALTNLSKLVLHAVSLRSVDDLCDIVGSLPALENLKCVGISAPSRSTPHANQWGFETIRQAISTLALGKRPAPAHSSSPVESINKADFSRLKNLHIRDVLDEDVFLSFMMERGLGGALETLIMRIPDGLQWLSLVDAAAPNLRHLEVPPVPSSDNEDHPLISPPGDLFDRLSMATHLRSLDLSLSSPSPRPGQAATARPSMNADPDSLTLSILTRLSTALEEVPVRYPELRTLTLNIIDRYGKLASTAVCARIAGALADSKRYPRFERLKVRVSVNYGYASMEARGWNNAFEALAGTEDGRTGRVEVYVVAHGSTLWD